MSKHFKTVVFDVDGTLLDTSEGIISSVKKTINHFGLKELDNNTLEKFIGPPIQNSFMNIYGLDGKPIQEFADYFRNIYKEEDLYKAKPYAGIYDVFEYMLNIGIKPAIATYKRQDYALKILKYFKFNNYTDIIYGADNYNKLKKKDIIKKCLIDSCVNNFSDAVMVGDSDNDAVGAQDIGVKFIGVTYGFGFKSKKDVMSFHNVGIATSAYDLINLISEQ